MGQIPTGPAKVSAQTSSSWAPVANIGMSYEFAQNWTLVGTVAYLPLKTTSTITLRSQEGQVLAVNKTVIDVKPVVFSLNVGYRF
jgi:outer membrane protein